MIFYKIGPLVIFVLAVIFYFIGVVYLSKKEKIYLGLILPVITLAIAIYNYVKPILIYNPRPTMKEGIYMTFFGLLSIIGFILFGIIKFIWEIGRASCRERV